MPFDLYLTIGAVILVFAIPSVVSAYSDKRTPRTAAVLTVVGGGLVIWAATQKPGGYALSDIPLAFVDVLARLIR